jgi:hypothetical protein
MSVPEHVRVPIVRHLHEAAVEDPLACLRSLRTLNLMLHDAHALAVTVARSQGISWARIGDAIGLTASAAYRRYADLMPRN